MNTLSLFEIIFIGIGLAMDAFAVSITSGITIKNLRIKNAFKVAIFFGGFQAFMPILGWLATNSFKGAIQKYNYWIAFILLIIVGGKMIYEAFKIEKCELDKDCLNVVTLTILSIATSIDALAVGMTFSMLNVSIVLPIIIIGLITFVLSFLGVHLGNKLGVIFEKKMEIAGGIILILIAFKILISGLLG